MAVTKKKMRISLEPKFIVVGLVTLMFFSYVGFQGRFIIFGPELSIDTPRDGQVATTSIITLSGVARNVSWVSLNDRQIYTDENGVWQEKLIVQNGLSIMTLKARDRFGREESESVRIILN